MTPAELDALRLRAEIPERLAQDPLAHVDRHLPPDGQEIAAYLAAALAFGNVQAIHRSVGAAVACMDRPAALALLPGHRWVRGTHVAELVARLRALQAEDGSLGATFGRGYVPGDMRASLQAFSARVRSGLPDTRGASYLASTPATGSACKRLNLFLRWMVRPTSPDLGLWPHVRPADLISPLDVHVVRFAHRHGLTRRRTVGWLMAEEVTAWFRARCPEDPLRWDFAISHAGMMGLLPFA